MKLFRKIFFTEGYPAGRKLPQLFTFLFAALFFLWAGAFSASAHSLTATIGSVRIDPATKEDILIDLKTNQKREGTDGKIYIFEMKPYHAGLTGFHVPIDSQDIAGKMSFRISLNSGPGEKRLYSAFAAAVRVGMRYELVTERKYIGNPEVLAVNTEPALNRGKKGLRVNPELIGDAMELNIKHAGVDVATQLFFGQGISYSYEGKSFQINAALINQLDAEVKRLSDAGIAVTAILLNGWNSTVPELNRPGITRLPSAQAQYYAFNVETESGFRAVKAMASFLAKRYNGKNGHGKITSWVIGNEINNQYWNYTGDFDAASYTRIFQRAFRVFYTAIKAECSQDNIMFSIDHFWNAEPEAAPVGKYTGREIVEWFNRWDYAEGRTDWGLALHPYPYPMISPAFWDDEESGKISYDVNSPVVNFLNLNVITDFMRNPSILNPAGKVRTIFLTEEGFTSVSNGEDKSLEQAAAVAYSYYIAENNPYIDAYLMSRQEDDPSEQALGLAFGLSAYSNGQLLHKPAHAVFKDIDDPENSLLVSEFAKEILGITDWTEKIPGFQPPK